MQSKHLTVHNTYSSFYLNPCLMQMEYIDSFPLKPNDLFMVSHIQENNNNIIWTWPFHSFFPLICWYKCTALHLKTQQLYQAFQTFSAESFSKHLDLSKPHNLMWGKSEKALLQSVFDVKLQYCLPENIWWGFLQSRSGYMTYICQSAKFMTDKREVATYFQTWLICSVLL